EAQEKAGVAVAKSVRLALAGELVPDAVNVAGGVIDPYVRPGIPLTEKLGRILSAVMKGVSVSAIEVEVAGELAEKKRRLTETGGTKRDLHRRRLRPGVLCQRAGIGGRPGHRNSAVYHGRLPALPQHHYGQRHLGRWPSIQCNRYLDRTAAS